ncbi:MAG: hypothetical protein ACJAUU_001284 [Rickettsiales bacterium]|jgi:hypothetical protein
MYLIVKPTQQGKTPEKLCSAIRTRLKIPKFLILGRYQKDPE